MTGLFKFVLRLAVIGGIMLVGATLIAGPDRVETFLTQVQTKVETAIDDNIDDPVALRRQLRELEKQYPKRISQVRADLGELHGQIKEIEREKAVAERVVILTEKDVEELQSRIAEADVTIASSNGSAASRVAFNGRRYSLEQAYTRLNNVNQTRMAYTARSQDATRDLGYLYQQAERLEKLLSQLETERSQFQAQIWQLDRQVDAVARNERLIEIMEKRQQTINELGRYRVDSLDQLTGRLTEIRTRQEATLDVLATAHEQHSYEDEARMQIDLEGEDAIDWSEPMTVPADQVPANF